MASSPSCPCQVCGEPTSKYRCSQCRTRSCSLACFKAHQSECTVAHTEPDASVQGQSTATEIGGDTNSTAEPPQQVALNPELVHDLFLKYPGLKARLNAIYQSSRQRASASAISARRGHDPRSEASAEDAALANGLGMLQRALRDDAGNQGINAFATYVKTLASS